MINSERSIFKMPIIIGLTAICMALIEITFFTGLIYADYMQLDLTKLLQINFYIMFFLLFGLMMILIIKFVINALRLDRTIYENDFNKKW